MGTLTNEMTKAGFKLSREETIKVKDSLTTLKKKLKTSTCKKCGEQIKFLEVEKGKSIPHNMDDTPHWQSCAYSGFTQKKHALDIMKKLSVLFIVKLGLDLEAEAGLTKKEAQIIHALLERIFKEENAPTPLEIADQVVDDEVQFKPEPCDSIGDPDEERAPSEEEVKRVEEEIRLHTRPDDSQNKQTVEKAIGEIIQEDTKVDPMKTPVL